MAHHHADGDSGQLVTQAGVLPNQLDQLGSNCHGNGLRLRGAARRAFSDRRGRYRPLALRLVRRTLLWSGGLGGLGGLRGRAFLPRSWLSRRVRGGHILRRCSRLHAGWYRRRRRAGYARQADLRGDEGVGGA